MFIQSQNRRYGKGLTNKQIKEFNLFIDSLVGEERYNLCEDCHELYGCKNNHDVNLTDTGVCSICGKTDDLINCAIANKVLNENISIRSYWLNGKRLVK